MAFFTKQGLGIDLGSSNTVIYLDKKGIALREPSIVAKNLKSGEIEAYGKSADDLLGRTSDSYELISPIRNGVIHHFTLTKQFLAYLMKKVSLGGFGQPDVVICAPSNISKVERRALINAVKELGVHRAMIVDEPFAAAVGAGLDIYQPLGRMIIDIGGGTTDIATLSYGEVIANTTLAYAGDQMDEVIMSYVRSAYNMVIGKKTAEQLKQGLGNANFLAEEVENTQRVTGQDLATGVPMEREIGEAFIAHALDEVIQEMIEGVRTVLAMTPPELAADILSEGIYLSGGGALIKRLPERITKETGIPARLVDNPLDVVAIGAGRLITEMQRYLRRAERNSR